MMMQTVIALEYKLGILNLIAQKRSGFGVSAYSTTSVKERGYKEISPSLEIEFHIGIPSDTSPSRLAELKMISPGRAIFKLYKPPRGLQGIQ